MQVVILGAGPAGLTAAETLLQHRPGSAVTLLSAEPYPPYSPPAMADYFVTGREETLFWKGKDVAHRLGVDYRAPATVERLDPAGRRVVLADGAELSYDRLVIATGSRLHAPIEGVERPGVYDFKSLSAASALIDLVRADRASRAVVVGAGFIGVEVALLLRDLGVAVTVVEKLDRVMPRTLDAETAAVVAEVLERRGVELRLGTGAAAFAGRRRVEGVRCESGEVLAGDVFIAATGVKPNVECLEGSGIEIGWGVRVDDRLRTNLPDVWAVGDVAESRDRLTGERYVHAIFPNAVDQGRTAAEDILGFEPLYEGALSMNSLKHLGVPVMAVGAADGAGESCFRRPGVLRRVFLDGAGRIAGFRLSGDVRAAGVLRSLMLRRVDVTPWRNRLADPRFGFGRTLPVAGA